MAMKMLKFIEMKKIFVLLTATIFLLQLATAKAEHFVDYNASTGEAQISNPATDLTSANSGINQGYSMTRLSNPRQLTVAADDALPQVTATSAIVMEVSTGRVIYQRNAWQKMFPASTTKIMTLVLALEHGGLNEIVTVSENAFGVEGSSLYLEQNDKMPLGELLEGMMLLSGNDAATAVAEHCGGNVSNFARQMNKRAKELGASNTNFTNPHGLPDENHYTTAYDLAVIASHGFKLPKFAEIVGLREKDYQWLHGDDKRLASENRMLQLYRGANGVKTGYTQVAGRCLVSSAKRGDVQLVAVVLDSLLMWHDSVALLDYGFANFNPRDVKKISADKKISDKKIPAVAEEKNSDDGRQKSFFRMILNSIKNLFEKFVNQFIISINIERRNFLES